MFQKIVDFAVFCAIIFIIAFSLLAFAKGVAFGQPIMTKTDSGVVFNLPCEDDETVYTVRKQIHYGPWMVMLQRFRFKSKIQKVSDFDCSEGYSHFEVEVPKQNENRAIHFVEACIEQNCEYTAFKPINYVEMPKRPDTNCKTQTFTWIENDKSGNAERETKNVGQFDWMMAEVITHRNNERIRLRVVSPTITDVEELMIAYNTDMDANQIQEWKREKVIRVKPDIETRHDERWILLNRKASIRALEQNLPFQFVFGYQIQTTMGKTFMPLSGVGQCPSLGN